MSQLQLTAFQSLVSAVTNSQNASIFCRNLVHSVLVKFHVNSATICRVTTAAKFEVVGCYGVNPEFLQGHLGSVFEPSPISLSIRSLHPIVCEELGKDFVCVAEAAGLSTKNAALAFPLFEDDLVCGSLLLTAENRLESNPLCRELFESLQFAAASYVFSESKPLTGRSQKTLRVLAQSSISRLSDRQLLILGMLEQPLTYSQIGRQLHVSESLVKQESGRVFRYLGVNTRRDAVQAAQDRNLLGKAENAA